MRLIFRNLRQPIVMPSHRDLVTPFAPLTAELRALLRDPVVDRPELPAEGNLELRDAGQVWPAVAVQYRRDRGSVDAADPRRFTNAATTDRGSYVQRKSACDLHDGVRVGGIRPSDTQLVWGHTRWARAHATTLQSAVGTFGSPMSVAHAIIIGGIYSQLGECELETLHDYTPENGLRFWPDVEQFVRDAVSLTAPQTTYTARRLMMVTAPFVIWCRQAQAWPLEFDVIFSRQAIEQYCERNPRKVSPGTLRNYRSMLLRVSEVVLPEDNPPPLKALNDRTSVPPYTASEMDRFKVWALGQGTALGVQKAVAMLALCAGAGLRSSEVGALLLDDLLIDADGIMITVQGGTHPREVPVLAEWEPWLLRAIEKMQPGQPVWGSPNRRNLRNLLSGFTTQSSGTPPRSDSLRATWLVTHLRAGTPMKGLMRAGGVEKFENLRRYLQYIPELNTAEYRGYLRLEAKR